MRMLKINSPRGWKRHLASGFLLLALLGIVPLQGISHSDKHEKRHEIEHLEDVWRSAILNANISTMDALLAEDYVAITPTGILQSKEQTLAALRAKTVRIDSLQLADRKVRFYGTTALVTCRAEITGNGPDGDVSGSYRYTRVYVQNPQGAWHIVSFEASRIRDPDEHK
jgi:ketosteroid isomerase-like protein